MPVYRIIDASLNRASEGLRTLEDYARFVHNDAKLSSQLKQLRHDLVTTFAALPRTKLLQARNTPDDVGTSIETKQEYSRQNMHDVVVAAVARTQQSLRCLEEYVKTIDAEIAKETETLRYHFYSVGANVEQLAIADTQQGIPSSIADDREKRQARLTTARLYALIDAGESDDTLSTSIKTLAAAGVDVFQLRDRNASDRTLFLRACVAAKVARQVNALFIVNDRADIAVAADADGVHVGQDELPAASVRQIIGRRRLLGISTHDLEQARQAIRDGADYIGCGPIFAGTTKSFRKYVGPELLGKISADGIELPAFAIGGIDISNVQQIIDVGCRRIAVTGALRDAEDPVTIAETLKGKLHDV